MTLLADNDDVIEVDQADPAGQVVAEQQADETSGAAQTEQPSDETAEDEVIVTIGNAEPPPADEDEFNGKPAPQFVKDLRKSDREKAKRIRELEAKLAEQASPSSQATVAKPTLADCDYDEEAFETKLTAWQEQERARKAEQEAQAEQQRKAQEDYQSRLTAFATEKAALKVRDYEDAEAVVDGLFSPTQIGIIVHAAAKPATLKYALGKNPAEVQKLASITDPVKFAFAVAKLEDKLSVTNRKPPPPPETVVRGSAPAAGSVDAKLAQLEAEADRTGDRSKVAAYRRQQLRSAT
jgi:hypothetical protein